VGARVVNHPITHHSITNGQVLRLIIVRRHDRLDTWYSVGTRYFVKTSSRIRLLVVALAALLLIVPAEAKKRTVAQKKLAARTQFETAERMREALNGRPVAERTQREYKKVIDAYRQVYYVAPTSMRADASIVAVAELLADMGSRFKDEKSSKAAIAQYEFLRREYPGSTYRVDALFTIGQIYRDDLNDKEQARATWEEFLKRYPKSEQVKDARAALKDLDEDKSAGKRVPTTEIRVPSAKASAKKPGETSPKSEKAESKPDEKPVETKTAKNSEPVEAKPGKNTDAAEDEAASKADVPSGPPILVTGIRHWSTPDYTRIAVDLGGDVTYSSDRIDSPQRIYFDLHNSHLTSTLVGKTFEVEDGFLHKIRIAQFQERETRLVLEVDHECEYSAFLLPNPTRLIVDIRSKKPAQAVASTENRVPSAETARTNKSPEPKTKQNAPAETTVATVKPIEQPVEVAEEPSSKKPAKNAVDEPAPKSARNTEIPELSGKRGKSKAAASLPTVREAQPTANGDRSLIRALGLKIGRIVVDAGHGGHDTGTIGPNGLLEKDLVLEVALRLGKLLENRLGAEVVYTRDDDTFIPLETRTAIANQNQADLFISVHANSSSDPQARGIETYYLNFTTSPEALEVAARENAVSEKSIHELQDLVKKIALKEKIEESREFASDVQNSLYAAVAAKGMKNRGVKKAPFIVLIGANMPSILAEISFVSNPTDAKKLKTSDYRQKIAEALYRGVSKYVNGLSGLKVAAKTTPTEPSR
jgi:N-acetylmuramoyl-L-alanine amidase